MASTRAAECFNPEKKKKFDHEITSKKGEIKIHVAFSVCVKFT